MYLTGFDKIFRGYTCFNFTIYSDTLFLRWSCLFDFFGTDWFIISNYQTETTNRCYDYDYYYLKGPRGQK